MRPAAPEWARRLARHIHVRAIIVCRPTTRRHPPQPTRSIDLPKHTTGTPPESRCHAYLCLTTTISSFLSLLPSLPLINFDSPSSPAAMPTSIPDDSFFDPHTARSLLLYLHYSYPIVLLLFFLLVFCLRSIGLSSKQKHPQESTDSHILTGPGGKPLPKRDAQKNKQNRSLFQEIPRAQKLLFEWLSVLAAGTFAANAVTVIFHALYSRKEHWWCGQSVVVRPPLPPQHWLETDPARFT